MGEDWNTGNSIKFQKRSVIKTNSWNYSSHSIRVYRKISEGSPKDWEYALKYPKASVRERILADYNTTTPKKYILRQQQIDDQTRHGVYLPAPTTVEFQLTVPENAVFKGLVTIVPPEASDPVLQSDGAELFIEVVDQGKQHFLKKISPSIGSYSDIQMSLAEFSGRQVTLRFRSSPKGSSNLDYLFVADPIVYVPKKNPRRIIWVFIDTLRQDHLSIYGYSRKTSPKLDDWAREAAVYTQARSIAPWTLPSARTMITGQVPERWSLVPTIQQVLAEQGWNTSFLAGNIYLSSNFDMSTGWTNHRCINWPLAEVQINRAQQILSDSSDRDLFMMLHIMDMHLPYTEPRPYRFTFAGERPAILSSDSFGRSEVIKKSKKLGKNGKQHVIDRYDNNLYYIDDVLSSFLDGLPEDSTVFIFSDHGEEFWDHDGFEHGHTLYDELLRIPFLVKSPNIPAGVYDQPISLLDLAPTTAGIANITFDQVAGWDLSTKSADELRERPQAFGRLLYGDDGWSSLKGHHKYITQKGKEIAFDLHNDPVEQTELITEENIILGRDSLASALQREVELGLRITLRRSSQDSNATVVLTFPQGIKSAWRGSNPTKNTKMELDTTDDTAAFVWIGKNLSNREAFIVPNGDIKEALRAMEAYLIIDGERQPFTPIQGATPNGQIPTYNGTEQKLFRSSNKGRFAYINYAIMPIPNADDQELNAFDDEVSEELKILGYVE